MKIYNFCKNNFIPKFVLNFPLCNGERAGRAAVLTLNILLSKDDFLFFDDQVVPSFHLHPSIISSFHLLRWNRLRWWVSRERAVKTSPKVRYDGLMRLFLYDESSFVDQYRHSVLQSLLHFSGILWLNPKG